jgi:hypothetical protein
MKCEFIGTCPKDFSEPESNEDKFAFSEDGLVVALCDGASESYNSKLWARMLSEKYVSDPCLTPDWIHKVVDRYAAEHDFANMSWSKQAAFERGSFATLLGIKRNVADSNVEVLAVGDCIAFLVDGDRLVDSWPFSDPEHFKNRPTLLSTLHELNRFASEDDFPANRTHVFNMQGLTAPRVFCMSDAIGEWALRLAQEEQSIAKWNDLLAQERLETIVAEQRESRRMRIDDSTVIVLSF